MSTINRNLVKFCFLLLLPILVFFLSMFLGRYPLTPQDVFTVLYSMAGGHVSDIGLEKSIILGIRIPRVLLAMLVGAGLALAGSACQGMFQNPIVSQDILGVSTGAGFGAVLGIMISDNPGLITFLSFCFGIISVMIVLIIGKVNKTKPVLTLVSSQL